jgi:hypothetical protein
MTELRPDPLGQPSRPVMTKLLAQRQHRHLGPGSPRSFAEDESVISPVIDPPALSTTTYDLAEPPIDRRHYDLSRFCK